MIKQEYSATRTRATWKPRVTDEDLPLYHCSSCDTYVLGISGDKPAEYTGTGRSLIAQPPFLSVHNPSCCGQEMQKADFISSSDLAGSIDFSYEFKGGFNNNCLVFKWEYGNSKNPVQWVALKTFTGLQLKYVYPKKRSPLIFAFADEDAFCYCDKSPCEKCVFRCKHGFTIYALVQGFGVVRIPLDDMEVIGASN